MPCALGHGHCFQMNEPHIVKDLAVLIRKLDRRGFQLAYLERCWQPWLNDQHAFLKINHDMRFSVT